MLKKILKYFVITIGVVLILYTLRFIVIYGFLFYQHNRIYNQGKILNTLPDTKFLNDESLILFFRDSSLYSIKLNGSDEKKLYDNVFEYHWSPDGKKIVLRTKGKKANVVILDLITGTKEIIEDKEFCDLPDWSPDSTKIAYTVGPEEYKSDIFIYDLSTRIKAKIERSPDYIAGNVRWTTDGNNILYYEIFTENYYKYNLPNREIVKLSCVDVNDIYFNQYACPGDGHWGRLSPNGKYRAYNQEGSLWLAKQGGNELLVEFKGIYNIDFGQSGVNGIEWLPHNRFVLFNFRGKDPHEKIYVVDIETKKTGFLTNGSTPMAHIPLFRPAGLDLAEDNTSKMYDSCIYMRDR